MEKRIILILAIIAVTMSFQIVNLSQLKNGQSKINHIVNPNQNIVFTECSVYPWARTVSILSITVDKVPVLNETSTFTIDFVLTRATEVGVAVNDFRFQEKQIDNRKIVVGKTFKKGETSSINITFNPNQGHGIYKLKQVFYEGFSDSSINFGCWEFNIVI